MCIYASVYIYIYICCMLLYKRHSRFIHSYTIHTHKVRRGTEGAFEHQNTGTL